jgi:hypothetical protein
MENDELLTSSQLWKLEGLCSEIAPSALNSIMDCWNTFDYVVRNEVTILYGEDAAGKSYINNLRLLATNTENVKKDLEAIVNAIKDFIEDERRRIAQTIS